MPHSPQWESKLIDTIQSPRLTTQQASDAFVMAKCEYLINTGLWPATHTFDHRGWLDNFMASERPYALNLVNVFLYYNEDLINALLRSAVRRLTTCVVTPGSNLTEASEQWSLFRRNVLVTYVEGENPNATDSGRVFARKARQVLGIEEHQIGSPEEILSRLVQDHPGPVLLLDDFIGSGNQMLNTWRHHYCVAEGEVYSFEIASSRDTSIFCVPLVSTSFGVNALARNCNGLTVKPAHILDERYSLVASDSILWPDELKPNSNEFLHAASKRAGILHEPSTQWDGFQGLGLALAFSHAVPDATIPLYYWERPGWNPFVRRN